tara:strand:+ start:4125 stop:4574 length:450 start_codon:yes stop_codon:yes gene_type:complete
MEIKAEIKKTLFGQLVEVVFSDDYGDGFTEIDRMSADDILLDIKEGKDTTVFDPSDPDGCRSLTNDERRASIDMARELNREMRGKNLKEICREFGLDEVAAVMGCTPSTLTRKRCAIRPVHEVEHVRLKEAFPKYSIESEIYRQAEKRG